MITLIPWIGGKRRLIPTIRDMLPRGFTSFVDVFGGGGTVTINLPLKKSIKRIYNDLNSNLTTLMRVVKEQPLSLLKELKFLPFHSRDEFNVLCEYLKKEEFTDEYMQQEMDLADVYFDPPDAETVKKLLYGNSKMNPVVRAADFFKVMRGSFSGTGDSYGARPLNIKSFFRQIMDTAEVFQHVTVENRSYEQMLKQYDSTKTLFYLDPPYVETEKYYDAVFGFADHLRLNWLLKTRKGFFILSYNKCDFILKLYKDFYIFMVKRPDSLSQKEGQMYEELIITNYDPREFVAQMSFLEQVSEGCILINEPKSTLFLRR